MAHLDKFKPRNCHRVRWTLHLGQHRVQKSRYPKSVPAARALYTKVSRLEEATRDGLAEDREIRQWMDEDLLSSEQAARAFRGWSETSTRSRKPKPTDYTWLLEAYEEYALRNSKAKDPLRKSHRNHMSVAQQVVDWLKQTAPRLHRLTEEDCLAYQGELPKTLSTWTVHHRLTKLRIILDIAVKAGMIESNPAKALRLPQPRRETVRRILSIEEAKELLDLSLQHRKQGGILPTAVRLGLYAGLRDEEMRWCRWDWIRNGILSVQRAKAAAEVWTPKDAEARRLDLKDEMLAFLDEERQRRMAEGNDGPWMICGRSPEQPAGLDSVAQAFRRMVREVGLDQGITLYALRHTYATWLLRENVDVVTVSRRLGHADIKTTQQYLHAIEPEDRPTARLPW